MNETHDQATLADILGPELARVRAARGYDALDTLETGVIRSEEPAHERGDGWSTLAFAQHAQDFGGSHTGIDLDTSHARNLLGRHGLGGPVELIEADSVQSLQSLVREGRTFDVILLDSGDDPDLILREYLVALRLVRPGGLIAIDDVRYHPDSYGSKGEAVLPYLTAQGELFRVGRRWGGGGFIDVVLVDFPATAALAAPAGSAL